MVRKRRKRPDAFEALRELMESGAVTLGVQLTPNDPARKRVRRPARARPARAFACPSCLSDAAQLCGECGECRDCCDCRDELFDADELGLDPEDDDERGYSHGNGG